MRNAGAEGEDTEVVVDGEVDIAFDRLVVAADQRRDRPIAAQLLEQGNDLHLLPSALHPLLPTVDGARARHVESRSDGWGFIWPQVGSFGWPRSPPPQGGFVE